MQDGKKGTGLKKKKRVRANCDYCLYFEQDEESGMAECQLNLDQDEWERYLAGGQKDFPYFRMYDEYKTVRKQI